MPDEPYQSRISRAEPTGDDLELMRQLVPGFLDPPTISVLIPVSDPDEIWIKKSLASVLEGVYPHVELCACDNASERPHVAEALHEFAASDGRVKLRRLEERASLAGTLNGALSLATGRFMTVLGEGDELAPEALYVVADLLQNVEADAIYADEDSVDISDRRSDPVFKPYWSPDLLLSIPYVGRPYVVRRDLVTELGGFREGFEDAEEWDLMLRLAEKSGHFRHLPKMLYHRRVYESEPKLDSEGTREASYRAVEEALDRRSPRATVAPGAGSVRVIRSVSGKPTVSVVALSTGPAPASNSGELGRRSSYPVREVLSAYTWEGKALEKEVMGTGFAARAANLAASGAKGEYLLFVRNYGETSPPDWIAELLRQAQRPEVGLVGGRVLDRRGNMLAGGSFFDPGRLLGSPPEAPQISPQVAPARHLPVVDYPFNPLAGSVGCMMVRRSIFEDVGGFDEENLPTFFYDLDFSLRLRERGLLNVYAPGVSVVSEGVGRALPGAGEIEHMWNRWWPELVRILQYRDSPLRVWEELDADLLAVISG